MNRQSQWLFETPFVSEVGEYCSKGIRSGAGNCMCRSCQREEPSPLNPNSGSNLGYEEQWLFEAPITAPLTHSAHPTSRRSWLFEPFAFSEADYMAGSGGGDRPILAPRLLLSRVTNSLPPGSSAIGKMGPAPPRFFKDGANPTEFEGQVARDLAKELGVDPLRVVTRDGKAALEGGTLPPMTGPLKFRFFAEPKLNISGGRITGELYKRPDLIVTAPHGKQQIEIFESTLDFDFKKAAGTRGSPAHKSLQVAGSFRSLMDSYPGVPIIFNIRCPHRPSDGAKQKLKDELREVKKRAEEEAGKGRYGTKIIEIIWRYG